VAIDGGNAFVSLNAQDVSAKVASISGLDQSREEVDVTAMGDLVRKMQATLEQAAEVQIVFHVDAWNDTLATTLATMWANPGTAYAIAVRPTNTTIAATNPEFQFQARLIRNPMMDPVQPGQTFKRSITLRRTTAITTDVTP
jgi:hypothetical protein